MIYVKRLRIGKVERYELDISTWLDEEVIVTATVTPDAKATQVGVVDISAGVIGFFLEGVSVGVCTVEVEYATATRSDCTKVKLYVEEC